MSPLPRRPPGEALAAARARRGAAERGWWEFALILATRLREQQEPPLDGSLFHTRSDI
jgi:hypothetical protein